MADQPNPTQLQKIKGIFSKDSNNFPDNKVDIQDVMAKSEEQKEELESIQPKNKSRKKNLIISFLADQQQRVQISDAKEEIAAAKQEILASGNILEYEEALGDLSRANADLSRAQRGGRSINIPHSLAQKLADNFKQLHAPEHVINLHPSDTPPVKVKSSKKSLEK